MQAAGIGTVAGVSAFVAMSYTDTETKLENAYKLLKQLEAELKEIEKIEEASQVGNNAPVQRALSYRSPKDLQLELYAYASFPSQPPFRCC